MVGVQTARRRADGGGAMTVAEMVAIALISEVWRALGGGEIRRGQGQALWWGGDRWSVSLDDAAGLWYDYRAAIGGNVIDLIIHVNPGWTLPEAARWLAKFLGVALDEETDKNVNDSTADSTIPHHDGPLDIRRPFRDHPKQLLLAGFDGNDHD